MASRRREAAHGDGFILVSFWCRKSIKLIPPRYQIAMAENEETFSQRMPTEMATDLEAYAEDMGISRNGAINVLVGMQLKEEGYR